MTTKRKMRILEASLIFLAVHLLLLALLLSGNAAVSFVLGRAEFRNGVVFLILLASVVLWVYTFRMTALFCRFEDDLPAKKFWSAQLDVWILAEILLSCMLYIAGYGENDGIALMPVMPVELLIWMINYSACCFACRRYLGLRKPQKTEEGA